MTTRIISRKSRDRRNKTGCVGVSIKITEFQRGGNIVVRRFFVARMGRDKSRNFSIDSLGSDLAWREAVRCRAAWERQVDERRASLAAWHAERERATVQRWIAKNLVKVREQSAASVRRYRARKEAAK